VAAAIAEPAVTVRFYRPELDASRFFAFFGVLVHHGPAFPSIARAGGFGLSLFFLLSAYLITELLIREREKTATVNWRFFFIRRALRIWPLYFGALALACLAALIHPSWWVDPKGILSLCFFVTNWFYTPLQIGPLIAHLWSISIEEQFYLIWPPIMKYGGPKLAQRVSFGFLICGMFWLWRFADRGWKLWGDTPVEFIFFGAGAILAIATHGRSFAMNGWLRLILLLPGLALLGLAAKTGISVDFYGGIVNKRPYIAYAAAAVACVLVFRSALGIEKVPGFLIYWGKISYGLYIVHIPMLHVGFIIMSSLRRGLTPGQSALAVDLLALVLSLALAHVSYQHFEKPFLKLKTRFSIVNSRPD
jgi:peptidoglycan/LPS O-acetylase OafA/YrhL